LSTDLAVRDGAAVATTQPGSAVLATLADWADELRAATTMATTLCRTAFVPAHFRGKPEETAAAILTGHELGLSPMAAVRSIFVIGGTPGLYAKAMVAVVQGQGHEVWVEEQSDDRVVVCGRRRGSDKVARTVWDRARVVKAKLTSNAKYQESPQQMMTARGQSEICRQIASDALHGVPYAVEELEDMPAVSVTATVEPRVTAAEILGNNDPDPAAAAPAAAEPAQRLITAAQQRKMHALLNESGRSDRDLGIVFVSGIIGREVSTSKELTVEEAGQVIAALEADAAAGTDEPPLDAS
jgi:hypothetical protein